MGLHYDGRKLKYSYSPGPENMDNRGNILDYVDGCDIYLLLEVRNGTDNKRLATGWFRSNERVSDLTDLSVDLIYDELPTEAPDYLKPEDGR